MIVDTALGSLRIRDLAVTGAEDCFASAVRLTAQNMAAVLWRLPEMLQPSAAVLMRSWCGDEIAEQFLRDLRTRSAAALASWQAQPMAQGVSEQFVTLAHDRTFEATSKYRSFILRARALGDKGACEVLTQRAATGWADRHSARTMTVGGYRLQTGCKCADLTKCKCGA